MSLVGAFRIIDSLEDLFRDYRGMNTKDVVNSLRDLRFEIIEEYSKKDDLHPPMTPVAQEPEKKEEPKEAPAEPKEITAEDIKLAAIKQSTNFPEFILNVQKMYNVNNTDMGRMFGLTDVAICSWKSGRSKPREDSKQKICRVLQSELGIPIEISRKYVRV